MRQLFFLLLFCMNGFAQATLDTTSKLELRVRETPDDVLQRFHDAGMSPKQHELTADEHLIVAKAFSLLPPLHQRILKTHLRSISFLDDMPNTALTSTLNADESFRLYHITIRAAILKQTVSEWLTEKERTCFEADSSLQIFVEGGSLNALVYVLMHESTHVADGSLQLTPGLQPTTKAPMNDFITGIWQERTVALPAFRDSLFDSIRYRSGGKVLPASKALAVYKSLKRKPFVSLYGSSSWHEDLAEYLTVYDFTHILKQPFRIVVKENNKEVFAYEPMKSELVKSRIKLMDRFYL
jgi:hypothetical protein